jgi:hypothetical protein
LLFRKLNSILCKRYILLRCIESAASLLMQKMRDKKARFSFGGCLRSRRRDLLPAASGLTIEIYAGLRCGLDSHSHVAHGFAAFALDDA